MDVIVIGAGVFGLCTARELTRRGARVRVLDMARPGAGASGGVVGALSPHGPENWRAMKGFQFAALASLGRYTEELEVETGIATGYRRCGRLMALATPGQRTRAEQGAAAAPAQWGPEWSLEIAETVPDGLTGWLDPGAAPCGVLHDTLSAALSPRGYVSALAAALPPETVLAKSQVASIDAARRTVETGHGPLTAGHIVIAAGWHSWGLLAGLACGPEGRGVKGQAAILGADAPSDAPLLTGGGLYVTGQGAGRVAVGSTSEPDWTTPDPDARLDAVIAEARRLCPVLRTAPVLERWAGIRPKPPGRDPLAGPLPGLPGLWIAGGGYKIGLGIAHRIGAAVAAGITGTPGPDLPGSFAPEDRLHRRTDTD